MAENIFGVSLILLIVSLAVSAWEIQISIKALNIQLSDIEEARLARLSDEEIDYSDIEELDDEFWQNAETVSLALTQPITLRAS